MIVSWLSYALVVSGLVSVAAWLAERGLQARGWPTRLAWAGGLLMSVVAPLAAWLWPASPDPSPIAGAPGAYVLDALPLIVGAAPSGPSIGTVLLTGWGVATALLLTTVVVLAARLALRLRRWPLRVVDGVEVRVSRRTGPAALGMVRGRVVVPEWALELAPRQRELLLLHETEHVRARDPQLAILGLLACVVAPWNLPLWWQLRRLRLAIEMDCDARVLRRAEDAHDYGSLLLAVGQQRAHLALALAEPKSMLERRIRMITRKRTGRAWLQAAVLLAAAGVALVVACETPAPTEDASLTAPEAAESVAEEGALARDGAAGATGGVMVRRAGNPIGVFGQQVLAPEGAAGADCVKYFIDGQAADAEGIGALEPESIRSVNVVKGAAAGEDAPCGTINVWTKATPEPIQVREYDDQTAARQRQAEIEAVRAKRAELGKVAESTRRPGPPADAPAQAAGPTFTPMTVAPGLQNIDRVLHLLRDNYPPLLRDAGIDGTANVWFFIDETGHVAKTQIKESSGYEALDQAALVVARQMEFTPAQNGDERVPVWVAMDITFELQ